MEETMKMAIVEMDEVDDGGAFSLEKVVLEEQITCMCLHPPFATFVKPQKIRKMIIPHLERRPKARIL